MKTTILTFLISSMILFSCSTSKTTTSTNASEPIFTAKIAVQTYSFRHYFPKDVIGTLDKLQEMGIKEIEGGPGRLSVESFKQLCDERGISIPSTGASFEELRDRPEEVVATAKALGSQFVMCAWIPHNERGHFSKTDADRAIKVFEAAGKLLKENNITLCYHPHGYEFQSYEDGTLLDYIIQSTNSEYVSFEMDIFWIQFGGGDPVTLLKKYGQRWKLMHLKDMKKGIEKNLTGLTDVEYNVPLGTGQLDMVNILKEGKKIGIAHYFIEDESSNVLNQVPKSIEYLNSLR